MGDLKYLEHFFQLMHISQDFSQLF